MKRINIIIIMGIVLSLLSGCGNITVNINESSPADSLENKSFEQIEENMDYAEGDTEHLGDENDNEKAYEAYNDFVKNNIPSHFDGNLTYYSDNGWNTDSSLYEYYTFDFNNDGVDELLLKCLYCGEVFIYCYNEPPV